MQITCLDKRDNESQDISVLSNLVEKLMKEIEFLRKENSILKKEDNPKRKAIASECKSEESSDKPIPTIKTQDIVKKTYEISHCSPIKEDMFKTHMFVSNRGRGEHKVEDNCGKGETGVPELFNFEDIPEEASTSQNDESNDETI
ncbi:hypothetical protein Tco_0116569 [Tanacetum coccineum]